MSTESLPATDQPTVDAAALGESVNAKTTCLAIRVGRFGNSRKASLQGARFSVLDPSQEPDKALLSLRKTIVDSPELQAIIKKDAYYGKRIRSLAFKSLFKGGVHLVPLALIPTLNNILEEWKAVREVLVTSAVNSYPTRVTETQQRLKSVSSDSDYPSVERFKSAFYLEYQYCSFETPTKLKAISAALFENEAEKARARLESVAVECEQAMRAGLLQLVEHLSDRLTPDEDGKPKRLHKTAISNLNEFLETFELRNVTDNADLAAIVAQARNIMNGVDVKMLKSDELVRASVLEKLGAAKQSLDQMVIAGQTRIIEFDDDDEDLFS